jgi:hypothetical protein
MMLLDRLVPAALLLALPAAAFSAEKPVPEGLVCPATAAGAELISTAPASTEPGVSGLCVYYIYDEEDPDRNATLTLRIGTAEYNPDTSFKQPKIDLGGMTLAGEETRPTAYGNRTVPATVISLSGKEADLGAITEVFDTLYVFRLDGGRVVSLEEEYTNVSADLREAPRAALLAAQE